MHQDFVEAVSGLTVTTRSASCGESFTLWVENQLLRDNCRSFSLMNNGSSEAKEHSFINAEFPKWVIPTLLNARNSLELAVFLDDLYVNSLPLKSIHFLHVFSTLKIPTRVLWTKYWRHFLRGKNLQDGKSKKVGV